MFNWSTIPGKLWAATKYLFLIAFSSIIGANLGMGAGLVLATIMDEPRWAWAAQGRCVGWTLFALQAAVGAPLGFASFSNKPLRTVRVEEPMTEAGEPAPVEGRLQSLLVGPLLGGLMGLFTGGLVGGYLIALYFFAVLSPLGPGGWWPILPGTFQMHAGGVGTKDPLIMIPWLIVLGIFVTIGIVIGLCCTVTVGRKRFAVFRPRRD